MIFIDEVESKVIIGNENHKLSTIARELSKFGPNEVIITRGDRGALIYSSKSKHIYEINAIPPKQTMDPTGLGDTYMAAYATKRLDSSNPKTCGNFASMVSTMKLENIGTFNGNMKMVNERLKKS